MKELRRIKPPLVYFLRFSRRKATSSTSNFFAETQVFFSDILFRAAPRAGGPTRQAVLRDRRSYGAHSPPRAGGPAGQADPVLLNFSQRANRTELTNGSSSSRTWRHLQIECLRSSIEESKLFSKNSEPQQESYRYVIA